VHSKECQRARERPRGEEGAGEGLDGGPCAFPEAHSERSRLGGHQRAFGEVRVLAVLVVLDAAALVGLGGRRPTGWIPLAEVTEDLLDDGWILDEGDDPHATAASRADQGIGGIDPGDESRPGAAASLDELVFLGALGLIGLGLPPARGGGGGAEVADPDLVGLRDERSTARNSLASMTWKLAPLDGLNLPR